MELEVVLEKNANGYYALAGLRAHTKKMLEEVLSSDKAFLKMVGKTITEVRKLKVGELRSLMAYGDVSKGLPPLSPKKGKKTAKPKAGSPKKAGKKKAGSPKKKTTTSKKTSSPKKTKKAAGPTVAELKTNYEHQFGEKAPSTAKKADLMKALENDKAIAKSSKKTTKKAGSPKKVGKKAGSPKKKPGKKAGSPTSKKTGSPKKKTTKKAGSPKKGKKVATEKREGFSGMTVADLKKEYAKKFGDKAPASAKKADLVKALESDSALATKAKKPTKPKTTKKPKTPSPKPKTPPKSPTAELKTKTVAQLKKSYAEKFGDKAPASAKKAELVKALASGTALAGAKKVVAVADATCTSLTDFKKCGDDEHCSADGKCLPGAGSGPYLQIKGRPRIFGSMETLESVKKHLGGKIVAPKGKKVSVEAPVVSKLKSPKPPKSASPKKPVSPKAPEVGLDDRTKILAEIRKCLEEESRANLV